MLPKLAAIAAAASFILMGDVAASRAQDDPPYDEALVERGRGLWAGRAGCLNCHGWAGDGKAMIDFPAGPNLRETQLAYADLVEIIRCGRPGSLMPYHERVAYQEDHLCYGATAEDIGELPPIGVMLKPSEIRSVAAYVDARIKGAGEVTLEQCRAFFGPEATCAGF